MFEDRFEDRREAGKRLAKIIPEVDLIAAIPRGGVPVAVEVAKRLSKPLFVVGVRKLPIPWSPEAGFGAIDEDGNIHISHHIVSHTRIDDMTVEKIAEDVLKEVKRRISIYRKTLPEIAGKVVAVIDDGFATGLTAVAAVEFVRVKGAEEVIAAAPCCSITAYEILKKHADRVLYLIKSDLPVFAVAEFYRDFRDLSDREVMEFLSEVESH